MEPITLTDVIMHYARDDEIDSEDDDIDFDSDSD